MIDDDEVSAEFRMRLRDAVEARPRAKRTGQRCTHGSTGAVAPHLDAISPRAAAGYRATRPRRAPRGGTTPRGPRSLAFRLGSPRRSCCSPTCAPAAASPAEVPGAVSSLVAAAGGADSARAAFDSVLTGDAAARAVMATLIPVPEASFLAESVAGSAP